MGTATTGRPCLVCQGQARWYLSRQCNVDPHAACAYHLTQVVEAMGAGHEWGTLIVQRTSRSILAEGDAYTVHPGRAEFAAEVRIAQAVSR